MLEKNRVLSIINEQLPSEFTMNALFERMSFIESVEQGLKESEQGKIITEEELDIEIAKWFK